jgi:hypothetical protein
LVDDYFTMTGAGGIPGMKVVAHQDIDLLMDAFAREIKIVPTEYTRASFWAQIGGVAVGTTIFLNLESDYGGGDREFMRHQIVRTVAHEAAHVVHHSRAGITNTFSSIGRSVPPVWFTEGAAEVEARTMLDMYGFGTTSPAESSAESVRSVVVRLDELQDRLRCTRWDSWPLTS